MIAEVGWLVGTALGILTASGWERVAAGNEARAMHWKQGLLTVLLLVVAALIVAYGIGQRVPVEHTGRGGTATIAAPPA